MNPLYLTICSEMKDPIQYMWIMWCACAILTSCFCSHGNISECRSYKYITHLHVSLRMHASETPNTTSNIRRWFGQMADPANDLSCTLDLDFIGPSRAVHGSGRVGFRPSLDPPVGVGWMAEGPETNRQHQLVMSISGLGSVRSVQRVVGFYKRH